LPWPPVEEAVEEVAEDKDADAATGSQRSNMDISDHDIVSIDEVHLESNSQSSSESSVKDDDEESRVSGDEIETEEYVMSQEVQEVEEVPEVPQSDMIIESSE
jgi:hypothetical protein